MMRTLAWALFLTAAMTRVPAAESTPADAGAATAPSHPPPLELKVGEDGVTIAFIGDSITQHGAWPYGYITRLKMALREAYVGREIAIVPSGVGNDTAQKVRKRLKNDVLSHAPDMVIVEIGLADLYYSERRPIDLKMFVLAMRDIIWQIRRAGASPVLMTLTVIGEHADGSNPHDEVIEAYSEAIRELAREKQCALIEIRSEFMAYLKQVNPDNLPSGVLTPAGDGVHLNPDGNEFLGNLILEAFHMPPPSGWRDRLAEKIRARLAAPEKSTEP